MEQGRGGQGRAEHQHSQAIQLFSMTILNDLRVTLCVCSEDSALFHIICALFMQKRQSHYLLKINDLSSESQPPFWLPGRNLY